MFNSKRQIEKEIQFKLRCKDYQEVNAPYIVWSFAPKFLSVLSAGSRGVLGKGLTQVILFPAKNKEKEIRKEKFSGRFWRLD